MEVSLCRLTVGDLSLGFSEDFRFDLGAIEKDSKNALVWKEFGQSFLKIWQFLRIFERKREKRTRGEVALGFWSRQKSNRPTVLSTILNRESAPT